MSTGRGLKTEEGRRAEFLPFCLPLIGEEEKKEVLDSLESGWITTGRKTALFEKKFKEYVGSRHSIAVSSCTAALHLCLASIGISEGDAVIVPTLTFAATANVVVHCGGRPVLVDVRRDTFNMDPQAVESHITPKTKAITLVHYGGQCSHVDEIRAIARKHNLYLIEDAAHALGATYKGVKAGRLGDFGCFSFYPTKNITTGEGGMITVDDDGLAEKMRLMSLHGINKDAWKRYSSEGSWHYEVVYPGFKYNMTDIQASIGIHQLDKLEYFIKVRQEYSQLYDDGFRDIEEIETPFVSPTSVHARHLYTILLKTEKLTIDRAQFIDKLREANIGTSVHFIPLHMHPFYKDTYGYTMGDFPVAEDIFNRIISLPLYPKLTHDDIKYVIDSVRKLIYLYRK